MPTQTSNTLEKLIDTDLTVMTDAETIVTIVRGGELTTEIARAELSLCSLEPVEQELVFTLPTPEAGFWWTSRSGDSAITCQALAYSLALGAGIVAEEHLPDDWLAGVLIETERINYLSFFSTRGIYGRISLTKTSTERLPADLRLALSSALPLSIPPSMEVDALYVRADFDQKLAAKIAESIEGLVEPLPDDHERLVSAGLKYLKNMAPR